MSALRTVLYKNKTLKDGTHPVRLRIYFTKESYISLGFNCKPKQWNSKAGRFNKKMNNYQEKNAVIRKAEIKADKIIQKLVVQDRPFSFFEFKNLFKTNHKQISVVDFVEVRMKELENQGSIGNRTKYQQLRNKLWKFKGRYFSFTLKQICNLISLSPFEFERFDTKNLKN